MSRECVRRFEFPHHRGAVLMPLAPFRTEIDPQFEGGLNIITRRAGIGTT
jgi:hypothetical protein